MNQHVQAKAVSLNADEQPRALVFRGLPGVGKTTLANAVITELTKMQNPPVFHVNADSVRSGLNKNLGFSKDDRIENARRIGAVALLASQNGMIPVVDFVMPTKLTFDAFVDGFGSNFHLWSMTGDAEFRSRFEDTAKIFERLQDWWGGGLITTLYECKPFKEADVGEVASNMVTDYLLYLENKRRTGRSLFVNGK